jgi:hypothetical protein
MDFTYFPSINGRWAVRLNDATLGFVEPIRSRLTSDGITFAEGWHAMGQDTVLIGTYDGLAEASEALLLHDWNRINLRLTALGTNEGVVEYIAQYPRAVDAMLLEMSRNDKIQAIKMHRTIYGSGLKEAKDYVEALMDRSKGY